jgi:hypothetical protein
MFDDITPGATFGCHDRNLEDGFPVVIDVLGPTTEVLATPEYHVRVYDRRHPGGWTTRLSLFSFMDNYLRPLTADERDRRLAELRGDLYIA